MVIPQGSKEYQNALVALVSSESGLTAKYVYTYKEFASVFWCVTNSENPVKMKKKHGM